MSAPATCLVTGYMFDPSGSPISGAIVKAYVASPFFLGSNYIPAGIFDQTTTDVNGMWQLNLVRTGTAQKQVTVRLEYPRGDFTTEAIAYPITVPETSTANFDALVDLTPNY
jgi:hypothetical protein